MTPPNKINPPAEPLNPLVLSVGSVFLWGAAALESGRAADGGSPVWDYLDESIER